MVKIHIDDYKELLENKMKELTTKIKEVEDLSDEQKLSIMEEDTPLRYYQAQIINGEDTSKLDYFYDTRIMAEYSENRTLLKECKIILPLIPNLKKVLIDGVYEIKVDKLVELQCQPKENKCYQ